MNNFPKTIPIIGRTRECIELFEQNYQPNMIVADIGSSFGWIENYFKHLKVKFIGVEPDSAAVEFAKRNVKNTEFYIGSASDIPLEDNKVDLVLFFDVIEHVPQDTESIVLKETNRILKKGGIVLLSTPNSHVVTNLLDPAWYFGHRHYSGSQLEKLLKKSGFEIISHQVKGGVLVSIYLIWFYLMKWVLRDAQPRNHLMEYLSDFSYKHEKIFNHFIIAQKI